MATQTSTRTRPIRYAVIGQGYFAQAAVLPAFKSAENAELVALVSDDPVKLEELGKKYGVSRRLAYGELDDYLRSGDCDAVYIALPNDLHREYAERAAAAGVHVLCEKPMALTEQDCQAMIAACDRAGVKLMVAYRLHFEASNLGAIELVRQGEIGDPRLFSSVFTMQVREGNTRTSAAHGGGALNDIGIYCVNAARYLFQEEPEEVSAIFTRRQGDPRFREVEEAVAAILHFPEGKIAQFTASFGASDVARYMVIGSTATLEVDNAYEYAEDMEHTVIRDGKKQTKKFPKRDQVAAELVYFSDCILGDKPVEPDGWEGLADVRIMTAIRESARTGQRVRIQPVSIADRPGIDQEIHVQAHGMPKLVRAQTPSQ